MKITKHKLQLKTENIKMSFKILTKTIILHHDTKITLLVIYETR